MTVNNFVHHFESAEAQMGALADTVRGELECALSARGRAVMAVPGGRTPAPFFARLSQYDLDWANIVVLLTDERCVPRDSDRSNGRLLRENLFNNFAKAAQYLPIYDESVENAGGDLTALCAQVTALLPLDICVLGMGADKHTASLFPDSPQLGEAIAESAPALVRVATAAMPEDRVTLSAPALRSASAVHILMSGADKYQALQEALADGAVQDAPVRVILHGGGAWDAYFSE